ncbi:MAG: PAS domain-containing protein [Thermodesulfobacteriota bacterium]
MKEIREDKFAALRQNAEFLLRERFPDVESIPKQDIGKFIDEIHVYQVELEIQNEELRNAQKELEKSRDRLALLYHRAPVGYCILDQTGMIADANRTLTEMLEKERSDLLQKPFSQFVVPEDKALFFSRFKSFLKKTGDRTMEVRLTAGNSRNFYVRLEGRFLGPGEILWDQFANQMLMIVHDISELKEVEKRLQVSLDESTCKARETEALLACSRAILEYRDFKKAARCIFDAARELIGATAGYVALLSPDGAENELLFLEAGGRPCKVNPELPMPIRGLRAESYKTGRVVYDNRFMTSEWIQFMPEGHVTLDNVMFAPLILDGKTVGLIGLSNKPGGFTPKDAEMAGAFGEFAAISLRNSRLLEARDQALAFLRDSEEHLTTILESISDGFFALDEDLTITYFNNAAGNLLGRKRQDVLGKHIFDAFPEAKGTIFEDQYALALREKKPLTFETFFTVEPYTDWYDVRIYPSPSGISVFFQITTERKAMEDQRRHTQKMEAIATMTAGIAHEFNNLLSIIMGNAELAMEGAQYHPQERDHLKEIFDASQRGRNIVRQLMTFTHGTEQAKRRIDLRALIQETAATVKSSLPSAIRLDMETSLPCDMIVCDPIQVAQVVLNLCANAQHAMADCGGRLTVKAENRLLAAPVKWLDCELDKGSYVCLEVADTGSGIQPQHIDRIFDPFFTTKGFGKSSGMGLAVVRGIMKSHAGGVRIISNPGKGTTVECYFPSGGKQTEAAQPVQTAASPGCKRIAYLDDEEAIAKIGKLRLERLGYQVEARTDPKELVALVRQTPDAFDVVITDLSMPEMSGKLVIRALREINPNIKTILCTGFSEKIDPAAMREIGADGLLLKPHEARELGEAVEKALNCTG